MSVCPDGHRFALNFLVILKLIVFINSNLKTLLTNWGWDTSLFKIIDVWVELKLYCIDCGYNHSLKLNYNLYPCCMRILDVVRCILRRFDLPLFRVLSSADTVSSVPSLLLSVVRQFLKYFLRLFRCWIGNFMYSTVFFILSHVPK